MTTRTKMITSLSLNETTIAILAGSKWEIYSVDADGLETFSHYATPGEVRQIVDCLYGGVA